jgi:hypothetical protein
VCCIAVLIAAPQHSGGAAPGSGGLAHGWPARHQARVLEANGRSGVPLYLLYDGRGGVAVLPQILTESRRGP